MFERPDAGDRAVLVGMAIRHEQLHQDLDEFHELALSAGVGIAGVLTGSRDKPDPGYFIGKGKLGELAARIEASGANLVLFNHALSPAQERNLERQLQVRVLDRTELILDIFAQRAHTFEGKLQVELAQLRHLATRLVRGWTHLERQKGGIGLRGPGETQLETDRRLLGQRIRQINQRLQKVRSQRAQGRRARKRASLPVISLVGYTNTGKSTLFNHLSGARVYAADQLFATLDPTMRRLDIADAGSFVLADTVGFISDLPHELVAAFRATLEETREADLLLHVIDAHDPERAARTRQVRRVLDDIGATDLPVIEVYNKLDLLPAGSPHLDRDDEGHILRVWLSAARGEGLGLLRQAIAEHFSRDKHKTRLSLPVTAGKLRASLYRLQAVREERVGDDGAWLLDVEISEARLAELCKKSGIDRCMVAVG